MEVSLLNRIISYIIYGVIALGVLGLLSKLFTNPLGLLLNIVIIAVIVGVIYLVYTRLTQGKTDRKEQRAFRKAVRQSKKRTKGRTSKAKRNNVANMTSTKSSHKIKPHKKSDVQLTVIEGKKNKKKNRASF
jgi:uncharacterized membrane protein (DUF106 family)